MANPSPDAIAAIRERVTDWTQSSVQIRDALNVRDQANPSPQGQVPKPMSTTSLMGKTLKTTRAKLMARGGILAQFVQDVRSGDRHAAVNWLTLAKDADDIPQAEYEQMVAEITATIPDPDYRPLLSWAELHLGRDVDLEDIVAARAAEDN